MGCSGFTRNAATTRKRSAPPRNATNSDLKSSACGIFRRCLVAFFSLRFGRWPARWARAFFLFGVFQYDLRLGYYSTSSSSSSDRNACCVGAAVRCSGDFYSNKRRRRRWNKRASAQARPGAAGGAAGGGSKATTERGRPEAVGGGPRRSLVLFGAVLHSWEWWVASWHVEKRKKRSIVGCLKKRGGRFYLP